MSRLIDNLIRIKKENDLKNKRPRPSWDAYYMAMTSVVARRATCDRKHVGAIVVDGRHRIVSTGYNGSAKGLPHCDDVGHLLKEIDGRESCVSGDTVISKLQTGRYNARHRTVRQIHEMWGPPNNRRGVNLMKVRSMNDNGVIVASKIKDVWSNGIQSTLELTTSIGRSIRATSNHRFFTPKGWVELGDLSIGDRVGLNGQPLHEDEEWLRVKYDKGLSMAAIAELCSVSPSVIHRRMMKFGIDRRPNLFAPGVGGAGKGWNKGLTHGGSGTYDKDGVTPNSARTRARRYALTEECDICGDRPGTDGLQVHHVDENVYNDSLDNLITLCSPCHQLAHTPHAKRESVVFDRVVSIGNPKEEEVFDLSLEPHHNFVGDGFILHNCVRTLHAESNALDDAGRRAEGGMIYVTVTPCFDCAKRIVNAGITRVIWGEYYPSRNTQLVVDFFKQANVEAVGPNG